MDKQPNHIEKDHGNVNTRCAKRSRWLTLGMMAAAASVIALAGCGDNEEVAPPAEESSPLEQNSTTQPAPGMNDEPAMEQDPGLNDEPAGQGTMTQPEGGMPEDTMDEPAEGNMNPDDEAGFGEGTDPMPGADDEDRVTTN